MVKKFYFFSETQRQDQMAQVPGAEDTAVVEDLLPNETLYVNNINEKINKQGKLLRCGVNTKI